MIIYQSSKEIFNNDVKCNLIADKIWASMHDAGINSNQSEINSWQNSLNFMKNILDIDSISDDSHIAIEYKLPFSQKRIDFMISGYDQQHNKNIVIIELKQWTHTKNSDMNDHIISFVGKRDRELLHPSYQAKSYQYSMFTFLSIMQKQEVISHCCSYLHNANKNENLHLLDATKYSYIKECPVYFKDDFKKLQSQIAHFIGNGQGKEILFEIENSKLVPSKQLINVVANTIKGNSEFMLIDSQKFVYENIMSKIEEKNNVFIINGNPGTGKSVVALNLLAGILKTKKLVSFVAPNAAYRNNLIYAVKKDKKTSKNECKAFEQVCKGSSIFYNMPKDLFNWLIIDEAHRLKDSSAYMYKGKNQIEDMLNASQNIVFFVDDNQCIRNSDIGNTDNIIKAAKKLQMNIYTGIKYKLETQFRCAGAQGYINALDTVLQIEDTGNFFLNGNKDYDVRICDTPQEMQSLIHQRIDEGFKTSRIVAGFAWEWKTKKMNLDELVFYKDIIIDEYDYKIAWNYNDSKMLWAIRDDGILQAGCIHTCQGLEFEYCGVIIGNDLQIDDYNNLFVSSKDYKDVAGKTNLKNNSQELLKYVKNIYKILLSRGQRGSYIFIRDSKLREYFKKHIM